MPAVLVEMGFLDHPVEGRLLQYPRYLTRIVRALAAAVATYGKRHRLSRRPPPKGREIKAIRRPDRRRKDRRRPDPTLRQKIVPRKPEVALDERATHRFCTRVPAPRIKE